MKFAARAFGSVLVLMLLGCQSQPGSAHLAGAGPVAVPTPDVRLAVGWRWESYGGLAVGVPATWGYGTTDTPWCLNMSDPKAMRPYVGRPGPVPDVACMRTGRRGADPATRLATGGTFVWFSDAAPPASAVAGEEVSLRPSPPAPGRKKRRPPSAEISAGPGVGKHGDRETLVLDGVELVVQAAPALRRRILATVHPVTVDPSGCPITQPIERNAGWRPAAGVTVDQLRAVTAVSACRYGTRLLSSVQLTGVRAAAAVAGIVAAPIGGGPDAAGTCLPEPTGDAETILLRISSSRGENDVVLRYSGCDHHGFDDGVTIRTLTRAAVLPFVAGPNGANEFDGVLSGVLGR